MTLIQPRQINLVALSGFVGAAGSGYFIPLTSSGTFATQSQLNASGAYIISIINASTAGVGSINGESGVLNFYGSGDIQVFNDGGNFYFGYTGAGGGPGTQVQVTGGSYLSIANLSGIGGAQVIQSGDNILISGGVGGSANTGELTGVFYPLLSNPSGYLTSDSGSVGGDLTDYNKFAQFNPYGQLDYRTTIIPDLNHDIDKRIWGLTATTGNKQIFSSINHTTATYIRNTGCWAYGIDLTPISVWNSQGGNQRGGILISPRHVLMAAHFPITGTLRWVTNDNQVVSGSTSGHASINGTDLRIAVLSGDVTGVSYSKVFSNLFTGYFNTSGIPVFFTDQEEKALIGQTTRNFSNEVEIVQSSEVYRSGFYELPIGGDSGGPLCGIIGNEVVALTTFYYANSGPYISYYYTGVNAAINSLGNSNGYQLTPVSQNYFPVNWNQIKDAPPLIQVTNNYISGQSGVINLSEIVYTTGNQTIQGIKTFESDNSFTSVGGTINGISVTNIDEEYFAIIEPSGIRLLGDMFSSTINFIDQAGVHPEPRGGGGGNYPEGYYFINWNPARLQLSGNWLTDTTPTQSGNLINKGYLESGTRKYNQEAISFYLQYGSITGNYLQEYFIPNNLICTGLKIASTSPGTGVTGFRGNFYTTTPANVTSTLFSFAYPSGITYQSSGVSVVLSGENRVGINVTGAMASGAANLNVSLWGYLQY